MSTDGETDEVMVYTGRIAGKGNTHIIQEKQDYYVKWHQTEATDGEMVLQVAGKLFNTLWLSL